MYDLNLTVFQGPLELLLHLIEKRELDITTVSLLEVTDQYLDYLHSMEEIDPDDLCHFIVIAAKLLFLKSLSLLPGPLTTAPEEEDPGAELTRLLSEYRRFKAAAQDLRALEEMGQRYYPRLAPPPQPPRPQRLNGATLSALLEALNRALSRKPPTPTATLEPQLVTITDKIAEIEASLAHYGLVSFNYLVQRASTREELVVLFLALLELIKGGRVQVSQEGLFGDILIARFDQGPRPLPQT